ncbi:hypothetical protein RRW91_17505 [Klebsiella grimontii]|uniref:hypothetical protein n=1 Tax=Klebsiella grimontii TaxID=2058152 RepID=UPI0028D961FB|nr:hypothetical protein [Klebsiella grimontii]MDT8624872.1 hypothetical protein [Klebsiella grimontii]
MTSKLTRERMEEIRDYDTCVTLEESAELARMALAAMDSEPVAWMVVDIDTGERIIRCDRSYIEGPCQPLYRHAKLGSVVDNEPYGFTDGDRRGMIYEPQYADRLNNPLPVYRHAQPAPVVLKDHQIRELVNQLRDVAIKYHGAGQLREQIARVVRAAFQAQLVCTCPSGDGSLRWPCPEHPSNSPVIADGLIGAVNRLLDSDGSRGCYSAIRCGDAHDEIERLLAAAPQEVTGE